MDKPILISVPANSMMIGVVRNCAASIAGAMAFSKNRVENIRLSLNEALANVIEHVYGGDSDQRIDVSFTVNDVDLEIRVRDYGRKVDPDRIKSRPLDRVEPHGLGVFLMNKMMDRVEYDTSPEVGTELLLVKQLKGNKRRGK
jgi:anti-sigma regulatory factor (Ser/Thr protein kinase)